MSSRQAVKIAARVLSVYFLYCMIANLINLPTYTLSVVQHWHELSQSPTPSVHSYDLHIFRYSSILLAASVLRLTLELFFAGLFFRCGAGVHRFLLGGAEETAI